MKLTSPSLVERREREEGDQHADRARQRDLGAADQPVVRLPGTAQRCWTARSRCVRHAASAVMGENVLLGPAGEVEQRAVRQEIEAGLGQRDPVFARQPLVELLLQRVEIADVAGRIFALRVAELGRAPVAGLLLLGRFDARAVP